MWVRLPVGLGMSLEVSDWNDARLRSGHSEKVSQERRLGVTLKMSAGEEGLGRLSCRGAGGWKTKGMFGKCLIAHTHFGAGFIWGTKSCQAFMEHRLCAALCWAPETKAEEA